MKLKLVFSVFICNFFLIAFVQGQEKIIVNPNAPEISFEKELVDMGTYNQYDDDSSRCEFVFTNTGKEPLIIEKAKGSCGCTVPEWPKEPIAPGETAKINVVIKNLADSLLKDILFCIAFLVLQLTAR